MELGKTNPNNYTSLVLVYTVAVTVSDNTVFVTEVTHDELLSVGKIQWCYYTLLCQTT